MAKHGAEKWVIDFSPPLTPVKTRMGRSASVSNHIPDGALNKNIASAKGEDFEALCAEMAERVSRAINAIIIASSQASRSVAPPISLA